MHFRISDNNKNKGKIEKIGLVAVWGIFLCSFFFLCYFLRTRIWTLIDSDMSSEMVLAHILKDEHRILSPNWYYSTELRVLYVTQIFALLFNFTDNWLYVRVYGEIIMHILLMLSLWYMMSAFEKRKLFPLTALFLCLPFSVVYMGYEIDSTAYIPYIIAAFLSIGMTIHTAREMTFHSSFFQGDSDISTEKHFVIRLSVKGTILIVLSILNAFLSSLIGLRQLVMFFLPAFIGSAILIYTDVIIRKNKFRESRYLKYLIVCTIDLIASVLGCLVNSLYLSKKYRVFNWSGRKFINFTIGSVIQSINGMINNLGFREEKMSLSSIWSNVYAILIFVLCVVIVCSILRHSENRSAESVFLSSFFISNVTVFILLYSLTDMVYYDLYSLPIIVFIFPLIMIGADDHLAGKSTTDTDGPEPLPRDSADEPARTYSLLRSPVWRYTIVLIILIILVIGTSARTYRDFFRTDKNSQKRDIAAFLTGNDYKNGYATFWNANVMTELSNGALEMYNWEDAKMLSQIYWIDETQKWLQKTSHDVERPTGKVFLLFNRSEIDICNWREGLTEDNIIYETDDYIVYGYGSFKEMIRTISHYAFESSDLEFIDTGCQVSDMYLYEGSYCIDITGTGLEGCSLEAKYFDTSLDRSVQYRMTVNEATDSHISAVITVPENRDSSRIILKYNKTHAPIVTNIDIRVNEP